MSEPQNELVMPFVCVASVGGPYDDDAFVAGYQAGLIDATLSTASLERHQVTVYASLREQLDLIAMRHGYVLDVEHGDAAWVSVSFWRKPAFGMFPDDELPPMEQR